MIDQKTEFGARVAQRLREESTIWLTTVDSLGRPQPRPVWFLWNETDNTFLILSQPEAAKVRHIQRSPHVALNLNCTPDGSDVVVILGDAEILRDALPLDLRQAYSKKYAEGIKSIGMTEEQMTESYRTVIRVTPTKVRGF